MRHDAPPRAPAPRRLTVVVPVGPATAGGFVFAIAGGGIVAAVAGLGLVMSQGGYYRPWGPPEPSLFLVEAMPLDAEITLNARPPARRASAARTRCACRRDST